MDYQGALWAAPSDCQPISYFEQQMAVTIYPNCEAVVQERPQRPSYVGSNVLKNLHSVSSAAIYDCITKREWRLNNPNEKGYEDVPSAENFVDLVARIYLTSTKMKDKFMPTQARLDEYVAQLTNPDPTRHDAGWRHYTKRTFEYFPQPTQHLHSRKSVLGLYTRLSTNAQNACKNARDCGYAVPPTMPDDWTRVSKMTEYEKGVFTQVPMTPFEDSYNLLLDAHVGEKVDGHYGRDATYHRICALSSSITKELAHQFVQNCPKCKGRNETCHKARMKGIQTERDNKAKEAASGSQITKKSNKKKDSAGYNVIGQQGQPSNNGLPHNNNPHPGTSYEAHPLQQTPSTHTFNIRPLDSTLPQDFKPELHQYQQNPMLPPTNMSYSNQSMGPEFHQSQDMPSAQNATQFTSPQDYSVQQISSVQNVSQCINPQSCSFQQMPNTQNTNQFTSPQNYLVQQMSSAQIAYQFINLQSCLFQQMPSTQNTNQFIDPQPYSVQQISSAQHTNQCINPQDCLVQQMPSAQNVNNEHFNNMPGMLSHKEDQSIELMNNAQTLNGGWVTNSQTANNPPELSAGPGNITHQPIDDSQNGSQSAQLNFLKPPFVPDIHEVGRTEEDSKHLDPVAEFVDFTNCVESSEQQPHQEQQNEVEEGAPNDISDIQLDDTLNFEIDEIFPGADLELLVNSWDYNKFPVAT